MPFYTQQLLIKKLFLDKGIRYEKPIKSYEKNGRKVRFILTQIAENNGKEYSKTENTATKYKILSAFITRGQ